MSEWADEYAVLNTATSADPGRWRCYPYQRALMDSFVHPAVERVVVKKSARIGWTKILGHVIGYSLHHDPGSVLVVQPTVEDAENWSREELAPLLEETPVLRGLVAEQSSRSSANTILKKTTKSGDLHLVGANSPRGFRRITVRKALLDEVDGYPPKGAGTEGDQIELAAVRTETHPDRKIGLGSTPTVAEISRIDRHFSESSRGYFVLACPHCDGDHVRGFQGPGIQGFVF